MRFPFFRNRDSVKNGILISIRRTGDGFHPGLFIHEVVLLFRVEIQVQKTLGSDPIKNGNLFESRKGFFFWTGHVYSLKSVVDAMLKELIYTQERIL